MSTQKLLVELINTRHVPDEDDVLTDRRAGPWLSAHGATVTTLETTPLDTTSLEQLRRLREGLRQLALANNAVSVDPVVIERARVALSRLPLRLELGDVDDPPRLIPSARADPSDEVTARAATAYLQARADRRWTRIKACAAVDCTFAFVDSSRNGSRRWCDMAGCGNRTKNRAWRARSAAALPAPLDR